LFFALADKIFQKKTPFKRKVIMLRVKPD
jgi:hypothetical protein